MARLPSILPAFLARPPLRALLNFALVAYLAGAAIEGLMTAGDSRRAPREDGRGLALLPEPPSFPLEPERTRIPVAVPDGLSVLQQTYQVLGIICRDASDRSVFAREVATGVERIYRVGDTLNGATLIEIHPSFIVLERGSSRMILNLFGPGSDRAAPEDAGPD